MPMTPDSVRGPASLLPAGGDWGKRRLEILEDLERCMERIRNSLHHPDGVVVSELRGLVKTTAGIIAEIEKRPPDTLIDLRPPSVIVGDPSHLPPPPAMPDLRPDDAVPASSGTGFPKS